MCERNVSGTVLSVVEENLCHGCGTCAAACPRGAIQMAETPAGFLVPRIDSDCTSCGLCLTTCPGAQFAERLLDGDADPFRGNVLGAWIARAVDERQFHDGQSAGVVTALLAHMMQSGACDGTLVVGPVDQSKRPRPFVARSPEELGFAQGSKYCPCAVNAEVREPAFTKPRSSRCGWIVMPCSRTSLVEFVSAVPLRVQTDRPGADLHGDLFVPHDRSSSTPCQTRVP